MTANPADAVREALERLERDGDEHGAAAILRAQIDNLTAQLAQCFKIAGADCDGNEDWRIAPRAVRAVTDLRRDYDEACNEAHQLRQRVENLEAAIRNERRAWLEANGPGGWIDDLRQRATAAEETKAREVSAEDVERACIAHYADWNRFHQHEREAFRKIMRAALATFAEGAK